MFLIQYHRKGKIKLLDQELNYLLEYNLRQYFNG